MSSKRNQLRMTKLTHSSLDLAEVEAKKKQSDVLSRARSKLNSLSEALKHKKADENHNKSIPKSMTQCTLDYFFKHSQHKNDHSLEEKPGPKAQLQKQSSADLFPQIRISSFDSDIDEDEVFYPVSRLRPATVCVDRPSVDRRSNAEALALERPRKKLSFKDPEVDFKIKNHNTIDKHKNGRHSDLSKQPPRPALNGQVSSDTLKNKALVHKYDDPRNKHASKFQSTLKSCENTLKHLSANDGKSAVNDDDGNTFTLGKGIQSIAGLGLSVVTNGIHRTPSFEDSDLESQAMRIVRTVGQAFEVCHKLSIVGSPEDNLEDEQDTTLTQDLLSDRLSDVAIDKPKKDISSEAANSDKNSIPPDESSIKDSYLDNSIRTSNTPCQLDILPPPPSNSSSSRKSALQAETYASPHSDVLSSNSIVGSAINSLPPPGGALSSHHEMQLLREQLEQQRQQTQAAIAQLQLAREQLQAEQTARMEAQARTHQLLVHNRELLDHIAALVAHLQGGEKPGQQPSPPHMTMPQPSQRTQENHQDQPPQLDTNMILQALGLSPSGVFENRSATTTQSPIRSTFNPTGGGLFNFPYSPNPLPADTSFENQLLQRIQNLVSPQYQYGWMEGQALRTPPHNQGGFYNPALLNNNFPLQNSQYVPYHTLPRSFSNIENRFNPSRHSEPRQIPSVYESYLEQNANQDNRQKEAIRGPSQEQYSQFNQQPLNQETSYQKPNFPTSTSQSGNLLPLPIKQRRHSSLNLTEDSSTNSSAEKLQMNTDSRLNRAASPNPTKNHSKLDDSSDKHFIKPLSQVGTLTTTDSEGRVRVIVPVPSNSEGENLLANLRISDELRLMNGPGITRSASERVPNRSELMSQVQRSTWARHTTK